MRDDSGAKGLLDHAVRPKHLKRYKDLGRLVLRYGGASILELSALIQNDFIAGAFLKLQEQRRTAQGGRPLAFEQAFSAAAQFIQVINQMQDEVLRLV